MISKLATLIILLLLLFCSKTSYANIWNEIYCTPEKEYRYLITAADGSKHVTTIGFEARVSGYQYETGHSSRLNVWPPKVRDTRQCHYGFHIGIHRRHVKSEPQDGTEQIKYRTEFIKGQYDLPSIIGGAAGTGAAAVNAILAQFGAYEIIEILEKKPSTSLPINQIPFRLKQMVGVIKNFSKLFPHALNLRTGINCGEASYGIEIAANAYKSESNTMLPIVSLVDYTLCIYQLMKNWAYWNPEHQKYIKAAFVYPEKLTDYYDGVARARITNIHRFMTRRNPTDEEIDHFVKNISDPDWEQRMWLWYSEQRDLIKLREITLEANFSKFKEYCQTRKTEFETICIEDDGNMIITSENGTIRQESLFARNQPRFDPKLVAKKYGAGCFVVFVPPEGTVVSSEFGKTLFRERLQISNFDATLAGPLYDLRKIAFHLPSYPEQRSKINNIAEKYDKQITELIPLFKKSLTTEFRTYFSSVMRTIEENE
jgi:hypothetical protein